MQTTQTLQSVNATINDYLNQGQKTEALKLCAEQINAGNYSNAIFSTALALSFEANNAVLIQKITPLAIKFAPQYADYYFYHAIGFMLQNKLAQALEFLGHTLKLDPNHISAIYHVGVYHQKKNNVEQAKRFYQKTLSLKPDHQNAGKALGSIYYLEGDIAKACAYFKNYFTLAPHNATSPLEQYLHCLFIIPDATKRADELRHLRDISDEKTNEGTLIKIALAAECYRRKDFAHAESVLAGLEETYPQFTIWNQYYLSLRRLIALMRQTKATQIHSANVVGDGQALSYAPYAENAYFIPKVQASHFVDKTPNAYQQAMEQFFANHQGNSPIYLFFGETDCRLEGKLLIPFLKEANVKKAALQQYVTLVVSHYVRYFSTLAKRYTKEVIFSEVPALNTALIVNNKQSNKLVTLLRESFNTALHQHAAAKKHAVITCYEKSLEKCPLHPGHYFVDAFYLKPAFFPHILATFSKKTEPKQPQPELPGLFDEFEAINKEEKLTQQIEEQKRRLAKNKQDYIALKNMAFITQINGDFAGAEKLYQEAIDVNPYYGEPYVGMSDFKHYEDVNDQHILHLKKVTSSGKMSKVSEAQANFALGKALHQCKAYDEAFAAIDKGNQGKQEENGYIRLLKNKLDWYTDNLSSTFFEARKDFGNPSDTPIFIVGLQRSGTSLAEQILAAHSQTRGAGELHYCAHVTKSINSSLLLPTSDTEALAILEKKTTQKIADRYLETLRNNFDNAPYIIDKMPFNFIHLPLIALLFPNAKIFHMRRHPLDNALSLYFQHFEDGITNSYSYDMQKIGQIYRLYREMMDHWHKVLPLDIMDLPYENIVDDTENSVRKMLSHIGLEWEDACLEFYNNKDAVKTASNWQVRQPIYRSSYGKWKLYKKQLAPLHEALIDYVYEYEAMLTERLA